MPFFPSLRRRIPAQTVQSGAQIRIAQGEFGTGSPFAGLAQVDPRPSSYIYAYHEGDLFTPGSQNFVFEPQFELPLVTIWGRGFIRNPNTFNPLQGAQVFVQPHLSTNGIGGVQAGDMELQKLIDPDGSTPAFPDWNYDEGLK